MIKRNMIIALIAIGFIAVVAGKYFRHPAHQAGADMLAVVVESFKIKDGWGYQVKVDGHTYIYQDMIPGVPGNRVFRTKEESLRVGNAVMHKLTHHQIPAVTQQELIAMQITI